MNSCKERLLTVLLIAAVVACPFLWYWWFHSLAPNKDAVDIATAVGTCLAAIIALFLGVSSALSSQRAARTSAALTAARLVPQLEDATRALEFFDSCVKRCVSFRDLQELSDELHMMRTKLADFAFDVPLPLLPNLADLGNHCAMDRARSLGLLDSLKQDVARRAPEVWTWGAGPNECAAIVGHWASMIEKAEEHLRLARSVCMVAARTGDIIV